MYMDTFWANMIVIWLMTILLTVTLFTDLFKRALDSFGLFGEWLGKLTKKKKKAK
jgi:hypothetical protein